MATLQEVYASKGDIRLLEAVQIAHNPEKYIYDNAEVEN